MKLRYSPRALGHLHGISAYLRQHSPLAARQVARRIRETINLLAEFPEVGREGALVGTREVVLPYIVVHRIDKGDQDTLTVLGIYHGAQIRRGQHRPLGD